MSQQNKGKGLSDPAAKRGKTGDGLNEELSALDPENQSGEFLYLDPDEIGTIQDRRTSAPHPFDGYRMGRQVLVGEAKVSTTHIVLLNPNAEPVPDRTNFGQTIYVGGDNTPKGGGQPKVVNLPTSHTRVVTDRSGRQNQSVVFDREVTLGDGRTFKCAIVKSHAARAQVVFKFDPKRNKVTPDKRYSLADVKQAQALYQMFNAIYSQRTKAEKAAREFDAAQESTAADKE